MSRHYVVFYSPGVKRGAQLSLLREAFDQCRLTASFYPINKCPEIAVKTDAEVLVAAGGDGTVNCVAGQAYRLKKPLGIVPLGTLNHFAKDLGLPLVMLQAVETIARDNTSKVDLGTVNGRVFLNNSSIGMYPTIVRARTGFEKHFGKWPAAAVSIMMVLSQRLRLLKLHMVLDDETIDKKSSLLLVGNNTYSLKGVGLPNREDLWQGKLHLFVLKTTRFDRITKTAVYSFLGKRPPETYIERHVGKRLQVAVDSHKSIWVALDGEVTKLTTPLTFELQPKALTVIVDK